MVMELQPSKLNIAVLGAGVWGSALRSLVAKEHQVRLWSRRGMPLETAIDQAEVIVVAVAMKGVQETAERLLQLEVNPSAIFVSATKGLDAATLRTPSQIWKAAFPDHSIVVLSGPNLSVEIRQGLPTATVVASEDAAAAQVVQRIFSSERFRVYTNADRLGTELGGTLKNVMAIAVGVCDGLQLGQNARAALITRALPEIIRVGVRMGAETETFYGLSGLGDLLATCTSPLSRNYQVGYQLAQGKDLKEILEHLQGTAEGVNTAQVLMELAAQKQIAVPVTQQVYRLLSGQITPRVALEALMERQLKPEPESQGADGAESSMP